MDDGDIFGLVDDPLFQKSHNITEFFDKKPLLAHYTTIDTFESILKNNELWFSNPMFMNDLDEVRFMISNGIRYFRENHEIKIALGRTKRHEIFVNSLINYANYFEEKDLINTYVFCLSEFDASTSDGLLSMWRGYGGDGKGVALVFDPKALEPVDDSPLFFVRVKYGSTSDRLELLNNACAIVREVLEKNNIPDDKLYLVGAAVFRHLKILSLYWKHDGFKEENEWRIIYYKEDDDHSLISEMIGYHINRSGIQPKLKLKIEHKNNITPAGLSLQSVIHSVILGPSAGTMLNLQTVKRMLTLNGADAISNKVVASTIPYRSD